jgi:class 3 adenylate cyclase
VEEGTDPTSLFNIARMLRMLRLVRLYKYFSENRSAKSSASVIPDSSEMELKDIQSDSRVGEEMSDRTTRKVIIGVFIMLFVLPFFQMRKNAFLRDLQLEIIYKQWTAWVMADRKHQSSMLKIWKFSERHLIESSDCMSLKYSMLNVADFSVVDPRGGILSSNLRTIEKETVILSGKETNSFSIMAEFDISRRVKSIAILDIFLSTFVILLLGLGTVSFSRDVNNLVIIPIEKMVRLVREISVNPLGKDYASSPDLTSAGEGGAFETVLLLRTISKIASLMRVGFGEAGAEIIGRNLNMASAGKGGAGGIYATSMNLMGNGRKIQSIFAFCDIRNFTDTTECLQEEVMLFVNRIAHILHNIVVQCGGAANKNIGDAFLLTWKVDPARIKTGDPNAYEFVADKALLSLLKTFVEIISNHDFICNFAPSSLAALYNRLPGYCCRIGCGLHFGWAIEGAIGTDKKIDASYISPHVNWSECLEAWTKEYGVPLLMSEPFFRLLSPNASKFCRKIDRIKKSAVDDVTSIYTYDANLDVDFHNEKALKVSRSNDEAVLRRIPIDKTQTMRQNTRASRRENAKSSRTVLSVEQPEIILPEFSVDVWNDDSDLMLLRMHIDDKCRSAWDEGMEEFLRGNWPSAVVNFKHVLDRLDGNDGPSKFLIKYIEAYDFVCPADWSGYRDLCSRSDEPE